MDDENARRKALNEALARAVNEQVNDVAATWYESGEGIEFRCECAGATCMGSVALTHDEYERVRTESPRFVVLPGHDDPAIERVVDSVGEAVVVEKIGAGRSVAEETDTRG